MEENNEKMEMLRAILRQEMEEEDAAVVSVAEAYRKVIEYSGKGKGAYCARIAEYITDPQNHVYGDANTYFNLTVLYLNMGDHYHALRICDYALGRYPYSVDLLANAIQSAGNIGEFERGHQYIESAEQIDKKYWNWRLFLFTTRFYMGELTQCGPEKINETFEKALASARNCQKYLPLEERGYDKEAELHLYANDVKSAYDVLRRAIFDPVEGHDGRPQNLVAPQCCVTMLGRILDDSHDYDLIIEIAKKGIQFTTQEQPSSNIGYFVYRSALARDARIVRDGFKNVQDIQVALREYQCAYDLLADRDYKRTIEQRYAVLSQNAQNPVSDLPLIRRSLVSES